MKAARVLDLLRRPVGGRVPRRRGFPSSLQTRRPAFRLVCAASRRLPPGARGARRVKHEDDWGGALQYLAAWDVHHAQESWLLRAQDGDQPSESLVAKAISTEPYASARTVFCVVDNGRRPPRPKLPVTALPNGWRNARLVQLPVHASWLNQVESPSRSVQRKVLTAQRFHQPRRDRGTPRGLRGPLRAVGFSFRVEVHPRRPHLAHEEVRRQTRLQAAA